MSAQLKIYSDGGGEKESTAASACIVEKLSTGERRYFLAFLGPGTNNEAEIFAGLLGFMFLSGKNIKKHLSLVWQSDSQYVLKSANEYILNWQKNGWKTANRKAVKNQGLWRSYLALSKNIDVKIEHVPGHSGFPENEACDEAATWARYNAESELSLGAEGDLIEIGGAEWILLDARGVMESLRNEIFSESLLDSFSQKLSKFVSNRPASKK